MNAFHPNPQSDPCISEKRDRLWSIAAIFLLLMLCSCSGFWDGEPSLGEGYLLIHSDQATFVYKPEDMGTETEYVISMDGFEYLLLGPHLPWARSKDGKKVGRAEITGKMEPCNHCDGKKTRIVNFSLEKFSTSEEDMKEFVEYEMSLAVQDPNHLKPQEPEPE